MRDPRFERQSSAIRIAWTLLLSISFVVAWSVGQLVRAKYGPALLRWCLQTCGAGFIKLGQILAMRWDLLPPAYCRELGKLLDKVPPFSSETAVRIIELELRRPLAECFSSFEPSPLGSASLAQVYGGKLLTGEEVAVKILRPGIERRIQADLKLMRALAAIVDATPFFRPFRLQGVVLELRRLTEEELDLRREGRNAQRIHDLMRDDALDHRAPIVYFEFVSQRVMTMERFRGVWVTELIEAVECDDRVRLAEWKRRGIEPERTARLLFRSIMTQVYEHRVFHADPHAANLIVLDGGTLAAIDFGMVGWLDERAWAQQYRLYDQIARGNIHKAYLQMLETLNPLTARNISDFEQRFKELLHDWTIAVQSPQATLSEKSTGRFIFRSVLALRQSGFTLPTAVLRLHRATVISDMVELKLCSKLDLMEEMREFFTEQACRQLLSVPTEVQTLGSVNDAVWLIANSASVARAASEWMQLRLPERSQAFESQLSRAEAAAGVFLRYTRMFIGLAIVFTIAAKSWCGALGPSRVHDIACAFTHGYSWTTSILWWIVGVFAFYVLGRLLERFGIS